MQHPNSPPQGPAGAPSDPAQQHNPWQAPQQGGPGWGGQAPPQQGGPGWGGQAPPQQGGPGWGGQAPPQQGGPGWGGQAPPQQGGPGWGAPGAPQVDPRVAKLDKDAMTWIIVGIVGYVLAFVWITGPLGWWQGNRICREFQAMGLEPSGSAKAAKWIGIIGTALFVLGMLAVIGVVMMMFVLGGAALAL